MVKEQMSSNYGIIMKKMTNDYFNPNYENSNDPFESTLTSIVSENNNNSNISNNSPPLSKFNLSSLMINNNNFNYPINVDPGFVERAAKFSCFGNLSNFNQNFSGKNDGKLTRVNSEKNMINSNSNNNGDSRESSSVSEQNPGVTSLSKNQNGVNSRKRKSFSKSKCASFVKDNEVENEESDAKKSKVEKKEVYKKENEGECNSSKVKKKNSNNNNDRDNDNNNDNKKAEKAEPPKDYIHVRARRGQATDSHSLAERVRREKISERMKFLQDLVPGCNKVTGKATVLDEIINYVQSLQRQVEFLSLKLSTMNPSMEFNMEALLAKDMFQSRVPALLPQTMYSLDRNSAQEFPFVYDQSARQMPSPYPNGCENPFSVNPMNLAEVRRHPNIHFPSVDGFVDSLTQLPNLWEDDLQSILQMGNFPNQTQSVFGTLPNNAHMKVEP